MLVWAGEHQGVLMLTMPFTWIMEHARREKYFPLLPSYQRKRWRSCSRFDLRWRCSFPIHQHKTRWATERNIGLPLFKVCFLVFPLEASSWLPALLAFMLGEWRDFGSEDDEGRAKRGLFLDFRVIFPWQRVRDCYSRGKEQKEKAGFQR